MDAIKAVGFDLFNTLIVAEPGAVDKALGCLLRSLRESGFELEETAFRRNHREEALQFIEAAHRSGRETHNRFWISATLKRHGYSVEPDDPRIARAVEDYFSLFPGHCHPIPETADLLGRLKERYRLGLLSNFTHTPAAMAILEAVGLMSYFETVLISGELGWRKPHARVFEQLAANLGVNRDEILFVGDDLDADIVGSREAGLVAVWTTVVRDQGIQAARTLMPEPADPPDDRLLRISCWDDLLGLLGNP